MQFDSEMWSALLGAVVGAVTGGIIAWVLQLDAQRRHSENDNKGRKERQQALAFAVTYKVLAIASHYAMYKKHFDDCYEEAAKDPEVSEPWQFVLPMADEPSPIELSSEELTLVLSLGFDAAFNSLLTLADAHNQMGRLSELYRVKREAMVELLPITAFEGSALQSSASRAQEVRARPLMIQLNHIAENMRKFADRDAAESSKVLDLLESVFERN